MAIPTGGSQGFNASEFRDAIHFAMQMGAGLDETEQVTFYFESTYAGTSNKDGQGVPFAVDAALTPTTPDPIRRDVAIEYFDAEGQPTGFGPLTPSRLALTLLDEEYVDVKDAKWVVVHGDRYNYSRTEPPQALFDVGVYVMHFKSEDET